MGTAGIPTKLVKTVLGLNAFFLELLVRLKKNKLRIIETYSFYFTLDTYKK
jgi:hypothetical protein